MILFLDDDANRAALMYERMTPAQKRRTIWCQTVQEAICTIHDYYERLELVMLDHDLEGTTYMNTKKDTSGMEVIRYIESLQKKDARRFEILKRVKFIVHSWNDHAGPIMVDRLKKLGYDAIYTPFGS